MGEIIDIPQLDRFYDVMIENYMGDPQSWFEDDFRDNGRGLDVIIKSIEVEEKRIGSLEDMLNLYVRAARLEYNGDMKNKTKNSSILKVASKILKGQSLEEIIEETEKFEKEDWYL